MSETTTTGAPKRPTFLTVLCILSFIGCGLGIFSGFTGYFANKALAGVGATASEQMDASIDQAMDEAMANSEMTEAQKELAGSLGDALGGLTDFGAMATSALVQGLMAILCLVGVLMMWKLKKTGFYIYTVAQVVTVAAPFIWVGGLAGGFMGILGAIFPILFIILYGVNLKHMS
ncbi:MAG TPA: hypothetical protein PK760_10955 [Flavobacteriales bacterium]|nr:hypothetical protein [Flavobacteriales bacterium]